MKKYFSMLMALLLVAVIFSSCKKESVVVTPKDYSLSIKDKTWAGTLTNAGEQPQYYSVHFNTENTLLWSQYSGDYQGRWFIDGNKLTLTFISPAVIVTAEITEDSKLANITTNTANKVNSGELVKDPTMVLENTVWQGNIGNPAQTYQFNFLSGSRVQQKIGSTTYNIVSYSRLNSGGSLRFNIGLVAVLGVILSGNEMNGKWGNSSWQVIKQ